MTEVAIRLAEPDRAAEQSIASLGQAVRRQVSFMNDAVSRALGRAGELEALVHNQVADLERSYEQNERRIRGLIQELTGERHALLNTSTSVTDTLKTLGTEIPTLIEKLSTPAGDARRDHQGRGRKPLELWRRRSPRRPAASRTSLGIRTQQLQTVLEDYTGAFSNALGNRTEQMRLSFDSYMQTLDTSLGNRTENLQTVFEEYARALDTTLANRAQALDIQLVERTKSLDDAFQKRLELFDEQILRSTTAIDSAVSEKAALLTSALDSHATVFRETIARQAIELDESVMNGINSVRRTSENITRQSLKAIEGLANQSDMLKNVSENLLRPDPRRHQPLREPGSGNPQGRQLARKPPTTRSTRRCRPATRTSRARSSASPARPTRSAGCSTTTPQPRGLAFDDRNPRPRPVAGTQERHGNRSRAMLAEFERVKNVDGSRERPHA